MSGTSLELEKLHEIAELAEHGGSIDGAHHKQYYHDQILRVVYGDKYEEWLKGYKNGEDGPDTYGWDTGMP